MILRNNTPSPHPHPILKTLDFNEICQNREVSSAVSLGRALSLSLLSLLPALNSSLQQREAAMRCGEGVNDLWSGPAADVGGMEVNRDEDFIYGASAPATEKPPMLLRVSGDNFSPAHNGNGCLPSGKIPLYHHYYYYARVGP